MKVGIWIDKRVAKIVAKQKSNEQMITVNSDVEEFQPKGGSGTKRKGGPQDVVQDSKYAEREKHQLKSYFQRIIDVLPPLDALVIFGPSLTAQKLAEEIALNHHQLDARLKAVEAADSMTDNQVKAWVRDFFDKQTV